ncbi:hypothetical protein Pcinc_019623 [Petrolisthes cinctipes]|uniref:Ionotropic glutamate receptor L-glutamate and glycine-binding domain-containing protein n=1 Tax=Petrolisthes cinctipes TaxID=88211 RepID=A0AAE1FJT6_PETCI|nr:hypothetical protein Pcinc_019623 [Petrolisthes cinctipes]
MLFLVTLVPDTRSSIIMLTDATTNVTSFVNTFLSLKLDRGISFFEVAWDVQDSNVTHLQLSKVVDEVRWLRQMLWSVTVVVVSDNPLFLAAFSDCSSKGRLLMWSTRLLIFTRLPVSQLQILHKILSMMNAMLVHMNDSGKVLSTWDDKPLCLARWTPGNGFSITTKLPFFPAKYTRFLQEPTLAVATESFHSQQVQSNNPNSRSKDHTTDYLAQSMNFRYRYVHANDGTFGSKQQDGSFSGLVGLVAREEADFAIGPFAYTASRAEVLDYAWPTIIQYLTILGGRGRPEIDPWGFVLPLATSVWVSILVALLLVPSVMCVLPYCFPVNENVTRSWVMDIFTMVRVILQQG